MEHQGGIYSRQVCFFRGTENEGYPFLEEPFYLDCIAVAAFRKPPLVGNRLDNQAARSTKSKIEKIFLIAHERGHDTLVLGALGCGAFQNPPEHIAELFEEVIQEFAGWFYKIVFAVLDDHNTVHGNYQVFKRQFSKNRGIFTPPSTGFLNRIVDARWPSKRQAQSQDWQLQQRQPQYHNSRQSTHSGHHQPHFQQKNSHQAFSRGGDDDEEEQELILLSDDFNGENSKAKQIKNTQEQEDEEEEEEGLARFGQGKKSEKNKNKANKNLPQCRDGGKCTKLDNQNHLRKYSHPQACREGGLCKKRGDKHHLKEYVHPPACPYKGMCTEMDKQHVTKFLHPIDCRHGNACRDNDFHHLVAYRHPKKPCNELWSCGEVKDVRHMKNFSHMFYTPCRFFELCNNRDPVHMETYSHQCQWGIKCKKLKKKDADHNRKHYHIPKPECKDGANCKMIVDPEHMLQFSHLGIQDVLQSCERGELCKKIQDPKHASKYFHPKIHQFSCDVRGYNAEVNFLANREKILGVIRAWNGNADLVPPPDIVEWVSQFRPIHRCGCDPLVSLSLVSL